MIRRGACSAEGNLETLEALAGRGRRGFCRISVSYFGILVRIFKHRVRTVFSFPNACREVDVTRQQTKTNFQTWLWPLSAFKSDPRPFVADLYPLETFLWKRNSNPCSEGFKITVEKKWSKILMGNKFCCIQQQNLSKKDPFYPINLWINLVIRTIPIIYFLILMDISYNLFFMVCP